jgi:hypothetical protein
MGVGEQVQERVLALMVVELESLQVRRAEGGGEGGVYFYVSASFTM